MYYRVKGSLLMCFFYEELARLHPLGPGSLVIKSPVILIKTQLK